MSAPRTFVYILQNESSPHRYYTGLTADIASRLAAHNAGLSKHSDGPPMAFDCFHLVR
jgi:predicted GIY-YIG superfamily endonuclease